MRWFPRSARGLDSRRLPLGVRVIHLDQLKHQQMIARFWMPLAVYHAWMFVLALVPEPAAEGEEPKPTGALRHLAWMLAAVWLQCVAGVYSGWFLATGLAVFCPCGAGSAPGGLRGWCDSCGATGCGSVSRSSSGSLAMAAAFAPYMIVNSDMKAAVHRVPRLPADAVGVDQRRPGQCVGDP